MYIHASVGPVSLKQSNYTFGTITFDRTVLLIHKHFWELCGEARARCGSCDSTYMQYLLLHSSPPRDNSQSTTTDLQWVSGERGEKEGNGCPCA